MRLRYAGLVFAPGLLLAGCAQESGEAQAVSPEATETSAPAPVIEAEELMEVVRMDTTDSDPVPAELVGTWVYAREECDADLVADIGEALPPTRPIEAQISLQSDRTYHMSVEGFPFSGSYRFEAGDYPRITLDTWLNFNVVGDALHNGSEGDAVYLCDRVFVRQRG